MEHGEDRGITEAGEGALSPLPEQVDEAQHIVGRNMPKTAGRSTYILLLKMMIEYPLGVSQKYFLVQCYVYS